VGTMITFRVGATDAEYLEKEFAPAFTAEDLVNVGRFQVYLKLMIDDVASAPFSARTLPPLPLPSVSYRDIAIARSREQFSRPRAVVEDEVLKWHQRDFSRTEQPRGEQREQPRSDGSTPRHESRPVSNDLPRPPRPHTQGGDRETRIREAVSLTQLHDDGGERKRKRKKKKKNRDKGPTENNLADLRSALSAVIGSAPQSTPQNGNEQKPKTEPQPQREQQREEQKKKEVPEHVLKDLFEKK